MSILFNIRGRDGWLKFEEIIKSVLAADYELVWCAQDLFGSKTNDQLVVMMPFRDSWWIDLCSAIPSATGHLKRLIRCGFSPDLNMSNWGVAWTDQVDWSGQGLKGPHTNNQHLHGRWHVCSVLRTKDRTIHNIWYYMYLYVVLCCIGPRAAKSLAV